MSDRMYLTGSEDVRTAGNTMARAADTMQDAVRNFDYALERHQRFMDDWLQRFEAALDKGKPDGNSTR